MYQDLLSRLLDLQPQMIERLGQLVDVESPSYDKPALDRLAAMLAGQFAAAGGRSHVIENAARGNHVRVDFDFGAADAKPALVLCHFDTVWPIGTLAGRPFAVNGNTITGPGCYDMKGGIIIAQFALQAIGEMNLRPGRNVTVLLNSDEEIGSTTSRPLIEDLARGSQYVLALEPAGPDGIAKTGRKGTGRYRLEIHGKAAHSGSDPQKGVSAISELAHQVLALHALNDFQKGTTVNVGIVQGGSRANVVADFATADIDARAWRAQDAEQLHTAIMSIKPVHSGARLKIDGRFTRPPMERTGVTMNLYAQAKAVAGKLGIDLKEGATGGAGDCNFTAAMGVPTLDGLGAIGDGAHAVTEHILADQLPLRAALLAAMLMELK